MLAAACRRGAPFDELARRIVSEPPPPLDLVSLGLPASVGSVVKRALAKEPSARYRDLSEMASALEDAAGLGASESTGRVRPSVARSSPATCVPLASG